MFITRYKTLSILLVIICWALPLQMSAAAASASDRSWKITLADGAIGIDSADLLALANQSVVIGNLLRFAANIPSSDPITLDIINQIEDKELDLSNLIVAGHYLTPNQINLLIKVMGIITRQELPQAQAAIEQLLESETQKIERLKELWIVQQRALRRTKKERLPAQFDIASPQILVSRINSVLELCAIADALNMPVLMDIGNALVIKYFTGPTFLQDFILDQTLLDKIKVSLLPAGFIEALISNPEVVNRIIQTLPINWWSLRTLRGLRDDVLSVAFSPDSSMLAAGFGDGVVLWNLESNTQRTLEGHIVKGIEFSPNNDVLASGNFDGSITLWNPATGAQIRRLLGPNDWVWNVSFSSDGHKLVSAGLNGSVILWDVSTGAQIRTLFQAGVYRVAFSPDGHSLALSTFNGRIILWDVVTGTPIRTLTGREKGVYSVAFSPDGRIIASRSGKNNIILWDVASGDQIRTLTVYNDTVYSVAFSADSRTLASGLADNRIILWDVASGAQMRTITGNSGMSGVAFSPNGRILASGSYDGSVRLWKTLYHVTQWLRELSLEQMLLLLARSHGFTSQQIEAILP